MEYFMKCRKGVQYNFHGDLFSKKMMLINEVMFVGLELEESFVAQST